MFNPREQATRRGFLRGVGLTVFAASAAACARPSIVEPVDQALDPNVQATVEAAVQATMTAQNTPKPTETATSRPETNKIKPILTYSLGTDLMWLPAQARADDGKIKQLTSEFLLPETVTTYDSVGKSLVAMTFNREGSRMLLSLARENKGKNFGIFVDGKLISSYKVGENATIFPFSEDKVVAMVLGLSEQEGRRLADRLNEEARVRGGEGQKSPTAEKELTLDQQARNIALKTWLYLLSNPQKFENESYEASLKINIANPDMLTEYVERIGRGNTQPPSEPIRVKWVATAYYKFGGTRRGFVGEMQINNVEINPLSGSRPITDVDRLNDLGWEGTIIITFIRRHHSNLYSPLSQSGTTQQVLEWLSLPDRDSLPQFSPFQKEGWNLGLSFKNGQWERNSARSLWSGDPILRDMELASSVLAEEDCGYSNRPCRLIR